MQPLRFSVLTCVSLLWSTGCGSDLVIAPGDGGGGEGGGSTEAVTVTVSTGTGTPPEDIGEPSDVYPAPHPDPPTVVNVGGPVMDAPVIIPVYFQNDDPALPAQVSDFIDKIGPTNYWMATTSEYGVGPASSLPAVQLVEDAPTLIDDAEVSTWLAAKLNADDPAFPAPGLNTLYAVYYPAGTTITMNDFDGGKSCESFGAYHSNTKLDAAHGGLLVPYAVMPRCGNWGGFSGVDALSIPSSHEFIEAATDPLPLTQPAHGQPDDAHYFWAFVLGGETGDLCAQEQTSYTTFPEDLEYAIQRSWSNASALAGHDPCVPVIAGQTYFAAAPVLTDSVNLGGGIFSKGVKIKEGETKTIDVKLFSDGPTSAFNVQADDITYFLGAGGSLDLSFGIESGQNGQTLHLAITVNQESDYGIEFFTVKARKGQQEHTWLGLVGN